MEEALTRTTNKLAEHSKGNIKAAQLVQALKFPKKFNILKGVGQCLTSIVKSWTKVTLESTLSKRLNRKPAEK